MDGISVGNKGLHGMTINIHQKASSALRMACVNWSTCCWTTFLWHLSSTNHTFGPLIDLWTSNLSSSALTPASSRKTCSACVLCWDRCCTLQPQVVWFSHLLYLVSLLCQYRHWLLACWKPTLSRSRHATTPLRCSVHCQMPMSEQPSIFGQIFQRLPSQAVRLASLVILLSCWQQKKSKQI